MLDPARRRAKLVRSKRVERVTTTVNVPRSLSRRRKPRASRSTETTRPSMWRTVAAEAVPTAATAATDGMLLGLMV
ncbi:MAG TPA: hypothetical protein VHF51_03815 [Solirubrobacteraceae bacterium]|nr:hypothetical protein [Solirubrobacteraceae bacterium]